MKSKGNWARRAVAGLGAALALLALAGCGGGTRQITPFAPTRLLVLGDEMSVLTRVAPPGRKYSVNAVSTTGTTQIDCVAFPLWHQVVADTFGFAYAECNPKNLPLTAAKIYAEPEAKVSSLVAQLARAAADNGSFSNTDLFTVLIGANDVLDVYKTIYLADPTTNGYNAGMAEMTRRGVRLAAFVNELTRANVGDVTGPKVIVSTIPLMSQTPYARQQVIDRPGVPVLDVLLDFSRAFNTALRAGEAQQDNGIVNDGRFIGLVELDALVNAGFTDPVRYGLVNTLFPVCAVALPDCDNTAADLVPKGDAASWLWASNLWMGPTAHLFLGNFARARALDNPF